MPGYHPFYRLQSFYSIFEHQFPYVVKPGADDKDGTITHSLSYFLTGQPSCVDPWESLVRCAVPYMPGIRKTVAKLRTPADNNTATILSIACEQTEENDICR